LNRRRKVRGGALISSMPQANHLRRIRIWLAIFIAGLVLSGITAFPLQTEIHWLLASTHNSFLLGPAESTNLLPWLERVEDALRVTNDRYPFLAYGTDWLAFAHLVIAIAFIGPYVDPVRNRWIITFGLISCAGVIPLALIAGAVRDIPLPWRFIDCSFGVFGSIPLLICRQSIRVLENAGNAHR
jgi:hypothetical protein